MGVDEVGRGPWAGPLVIGAVILPKDAEGNYPDWVAPLTDSKKLSEKKREEYSKIILKNALAAGLGWVSSEEIDSLGLSESLRLATRRAVKEVQTKKVPFGEIIIDGTQNFLAGTALEKYVTVLKKADLLIKEVSAASIIAKVARDNYMKDLAKKFPEYGFEKHVGYGTKLHKQMLEQFGPCPEHRNSFKPLKKSDKITTKELGDRAENLVANYLVRSGHRIVARNHKTRFYEIDIVSTKDDKIYFTEVKYRKSQYRGTSLDMVTPKKLSQMTFAAQSFLKYFKDFENYSPLLAVGLIKGEDFEFDDWLVLD